MNRTISKCLYLLRHAKSSWDDRTAGDHERPLAPRGLEAAERLADHFVRAAIHPDLVLCSSAVRARETLAPIVSAVGLEDQVQVEAALYGATAEGLLARLQRVDDRANSVLVVGHNPGLHDLALALVQDDSEILHRLLEKFPTGALAVVVSDAGSWSDFSPATTQVASLSFPRELAT